MKKHIKTKQLGRDSQARKALFRGLVVSLVEHEEIKTTSAKARAVRGIFEKLLTKGKLGSVHARRQIQSFIQDKDMVKKLVDDIAPRYQGVPGGYTKLTIIGNRRGDSAPIVKLSLTKEAKKVETDKKTTKKTPAKQAKASIAPKATTPHEAGTEKTKITAPKVASRAGKRGDR